MSDTATPQDAALRFETLDSLCLHLETHALNYGHLHQITDLFQALRDRLATAGDTVGTAKTQYEIDFFRFVIRDNTLLPNFSGTTDDGTPFEYPTLSSFTDETYAYLEERLSSTKNPLLAARYGHILWLSPKRSANAARQAVEAYLTLLSTYERKDRLAPQESFGLDLLAVAKNAYILAAQTRYRREDLARDIRRLVLRFNSRSSSAFALKANLVSFMLEPTRRFRKDEFVGLDDACWHLGTRLIKAKNYHAVVNVSGLGERVAAKLGIKKRNWHVRIGTAYGSLMKEAQASNNPAASHFCHLALEHFKRSKSAVKVRRIEAAYSALRTSQTFGAVTTSIDLSDHLERCRRIGGEIALKTPKDILVLLMVNQDLLPRVVKMQELAREQSKTFLVQRLFPVTIVDHVGHPAEHFATDEEKVRHAILQNYDWEVRLNKAYFINEIILAAVKAGKLTLSTVIPFLRQHSWFGKQLVKRLPNNTTHVYFWLGSIGPALAEYFAQIEQCYINPSHRPYFHLVIDSLATKIEGLLRDMCRLQGGVTFYSTTDNQGRPIAREKDLNALIREDTVTSLLNEDDLLFLRYLLVEKAGLNLRHRVAHGLMTAGEYEMFVAHLLFLAILRLGQYDLEETEVVD